MPFLSLFHLILLLIWAPWLCFLSPFEIPFPIVWLFDCSILCETMFCWALLLSLNLFLAPSLVLSLYFVGPASESIVSNKKIRVKFANKQIKQHRMNNRNNNKYNGNEAPNTHIAPIRLIQECILKFLNVTCVVCSVVAGIGDTHTQNHLSLSLLFPLILCEWTSNTLSIDSIDNVFVMCALFLFSSLLCLVPESMIFTTRRDKSMSL